MPCRPSLAFILIAGLIVVFAVKANYDSGHDTAPAPTAAERAAKEAEQRRYLAVAIVAKKVKNAMRDPESVVWESIRADEKAETVCLSYRARNGFGGMTREAVTVTPTGSGQDAALWNRHCQAKNSTTCSTSATRFNSAVHQAGTRRSAQHSPPACGFFSPGHEL